MSVLNTVVDPGAFFEERSDDISLLRASTVVLIVAALTVGTVYLTAETMLSAIPDDAQQVSSIIYGTTIVAGVVGTLGLWLIYAVVFHALAKLVYEAEGSFRETLAVTAWGFGPQILGSLVTLGVTYYVFSVQGIVYPDTSSIQAIQQYTQSVQSRPLFQWTTVAGVLFTLWSGFVWITGLSNVLAINERDAFVVVAIPVAVSVAWTLFGLL